MRLLDRGMRISFLSTIQTRDNLGSALLYENANGVRYQYSYSPWGVRTHMVGDSIRVYQPGESLPLLFYRTYTGHEDLWMFGLINANARLYSPYLGRFVSPDPLLNEEGGPLLYNPYIYAMNNPYKYIDRNGEFWWLVAAAVFGGGANVMAHFDDINSTGDFFKFFGVGAAAGVISAGIGVIASPVITGAMGGVGLAAFSGAAIFGLTAASDYLLHAGLNTAILGLPFNFSWKDFGIQVATATLIGGTTGYFNAKANGLNPWTGKSAVMATRPSPLMTEPDKLSTLPSDDLPTYSQPDPADVLEQARIQAGQGNSTVYVGVDKDNVIRYVGRTDRNPEIRFGEHYRSGHMTSTLKFKPITRNIDHNSSRILEQELINKYGMQKNGGQLFNKINSISAKHWEKFGIK